jgi:hypothetical protein
MWGVGGRIRVPRCVLPLRRRVDADRGRGARRRRVRRRGVVKEAAGSRWGGYFGYFSVWNKEDSIITPSCLFASELEKVHRYLATWVVRGARESPRA